MASIHKDELLLAAKDLKQSNSLDFCSGFDMGVDWAVRYMKEILDTECKTYQPEKSERTY
ncbi:hypothetical protein LCGC14_0408920 [marine sediment metagenome]|uniref:Uncharacterized protein n=1 Tax=marine sediment metagenome TaxID=412755 RepID=A0A0F9SUJ8_9ZZZZ